jgi:hypothetical protein
MHFVMERFCIKGRKRGIPSSWGELEFACICLGELAFMLCELFVSPEFALCFALLPIVSSPFASP